MVISFSEQVIKGTKSSVQTTIDLHMEEVDRLAVEEMSFFDDWIKLRAYHHLSIFRTKGYFAKIMKDERIVFAYAKTKNVIEAMNRIQYFLLKLKVEQLTLAISSLKSNYDPQSPTVFHDQAVIQQLSNDLCRMTDAVAAIEKEVKGVPVEIPEGDIPEIFKRKPVEERAKTSPRDEVSSTPAHSSIPAASSSIPSVQELVSGEEVITSIVQNPVVALSTVATQIQDVCIPDLGIFFI